MKNISKFFGNVHALNNVEFSAERGKVHGLIGANGAGKSTLVKILSGIHQPDNGRIFIDGREVRFQTPSEAQAMGIGIVPQEMELIMDMSVEENVLLTKLPNRNRFFIDFRRMREEAKTLLQSVHLEVHPSSLVRNLKYIEKVKTEIARVLSLSPSICIFDEVSSTLCPPEVKELYEVVRRLRDDGSAIIYITHRLEELFDICDEITILRNGELVGEYPVDQIDISQAGELMIGSSQDNSVKPKMSYDKTREIILSVRNLSSSKMFDDVSFDLRKGEILVLVGVVGSGIEDLTEALFGLKPVDTGEILLHGEEIVIENPMQAIKSGIMFLPQNRQDALVFTMSVKQNVTLSILDQLRKFHWFINQHEEKELVDQWVENLNIKAATVDANMPSLSGGNQQKVVLSRLLARKPKILVLQDPTRGVDVGVKAELRDILNKLSEEGVSMIIASSEIPEALKLHHRIIVMHDGKIRDELQGEHVTEAEVERCMVIGK